jgi:hypothetical protein
MCPVHYTQHMLPILKSQALLRHEKNSHKLLFVYHQMPPADAPVFQARGGSRRSLFGGMGGGTARSAYR